MISFFFFNDTATTEIYTLSLHDALPISRLTNNRIATAIPAKIVEITYSTNFDPNEIKRGYFILTATAATPRDRKSTRLNSSHANISYAVFCLKKKKKHQNESSYNV